MRSTVLLFMSLSRTKQPPPGYEFMDTLIYTGQFVCEATTAFLMFDQVGVVFRKCDTPPTKAADRAADRAAENATGHRFEPHSAPR